MCISNLIRCGWAEGDEQYMHYHDEEWGVPVADDIRLFEKMSLEGFQAGLSWLTILRKREHFRAAFAGFDFVQLAKFGQNDIDRLMGDAGIVRHRGKIEAVLHNALLVPQIQKEFGSLAAYVWRFEPEDHGGVDSAQDIRSVCAESIALSKDLKKRGFKFVGPTTMYALMQAMGMVNDHVRGCFCHEIIEEKRRVFKRPNS